MNKYYDLPLQPISRTKTHTQKSTTQLEQLTSPIETQELGQMGDADGRYNLPCRRNHDLFVDYEQKENRPALVNNLFGECSPFASNDKHTELLNAVSVPNGQRQDLRLKVSSIYEKLLQENKKKAKNEPIITQATFKPKDLKRQLSNHHRSLGQNLSRVKTFDKNRVNSHSKTNTKEKKIMEVAKKLEFAVGAKTKYQKILQQHFQAGFSSKRSEALTADEVRLSKICGKNSSILKLKSRLQPNIFSIKCPNDAKSLKPKLQKVQKVCQQQRGLEAQLHKLKAPEPKRLEKQPLKQSQRQLKQCQSQRWMSMNFHERQQRVLSNRKQKQVMGKQKKMEQEIKPCTFKPELTRPKSQKTIQPEKNSYYAQYYEKIYKRY